MTHHTLLGRTEDELLWFQRRSFLRGHRSRAFLFGDPGVVLGQPPEHSIAPPDWGANRIDNHRFSSHLVYGSTVRRGAR